MERIDYTNHVHELEGIEGEFELIELLQYMKPNSDVMGNDFAFSFADDFQISLVINESRVCHGLDILLILNDHNEPRFCINSDNDGRFESRKMAIKGDEVVFWVEHQGQEQTMWLTLNNKATETLKNQMLNALIEFNRAA